MITKQQIGKNIGFSIVSQVVSLAVTSIVYLIVPKVIPDIQYANWQVYSLYISYVGICHFGLLDGIVLRYSQFDYDQLDKNRIRSQFLFLLILLSGISFILLIIGTISLKGTSFLTLAMVAAGLITRNINMYTSYTFQITNRINYYAYFNIGRSIFFGFATTLLLFIGIENFCWYCMADISADLFIFVFTYRWNRDVYFGRIMSLRETLIEARNNISSGIQLMLSNWAATFLVGSAKMVVQWRWDLIFFGRVSFAFTLSNLFLTFVSAISVVLFPSLKRVNEETLPGLYSAIRNAVMPVLFFVLISYFPGYIIMELWLPAYKDSLVFLGVLLPMVVFTSLTSLLVNNYLKAYRCERQMFIINVATMVVGLCIFAVAGYWLNNVYLILIFTVALIIIRTIVSEIIVSRHINVYFVKDNIIEIIMSVVFVLCTRFSSLMVGCLGYAVALLIYGVIYFRKRKIVD